MAHNDLRFSACTVWVMQRGPLLKKSLRSAWLASGIAAAACVFSPAQAADKALAFVVKDWFNAIYETKFMDECPEGLAVANDEFWWRGLSKKDRARLTEDGLVQTLNRHNIAVARGPKGEDVCLSPTLVQDPPLRVVEGKLAYGANLDGIFGVLPTVVWTSAGP